MNVITVERVGKTYRQYDAERPRTLQEAAMSGFRNLTRGPRFWSLREVSFTVPKGRALGVIGRNGAGKSTLLRLLAGVSRPDEGQIDVRGRVGGLLELTAGFHPDLTGRENVFIGGVVRGLTRREVKDRFDAILDLAELAHVVNRPLRTYSSGMQMRLAFAVAVHCEPDLLLVDEVLAVGDAAFQTKCVDRIAAMLAAGCAVVMVSHDAGQVQDLCNDALWLREGVVAAVGDTKPVIAEYRKSLVHATVKRTRPEVPAVVTSQGMLLKPGVNRYGSAEIAIVDVRLATSDGSAAEMADGNTLSVEMDYVVATPVESPIFCVTIVDGSGREVMSTSTEQAGLIIPPGDPGGHLTAQLRSVHLEPGTYFVDVGVYERHWTFAYDYHSRAYPIIIRQGGAATGEQAGSLPRTVWVHNRRESSRVGS